MWICQRCQTENRDSVRMCPVCGNTRSAGRFGSAPQQRSGMGSAPRVTAAQPAQATEQLQPSPVRSGYQPPEGNARPPRRKGGGFSRTVGGLLCVLLPAMTLALAWQQREILFPVLTPLFTGPEAPDWLNWTCYGLLSLAAALLALLPGLWTLLLNRRK